MTIALALPRVGAAQDRKAELGASYTVLHLSSDEFSGTSVGPQWTWIRQDPANERVSGGALTITPEQGDLNGTNPPARNILLQPALWNWAKVSKLTFSTAPHVANQQGGLIAYQNDANWLKVDWEFSNGAAQLAAVVHRGLARRAEERFADVRAMAQALAVFG